MRLTKGSPCRFRPLTLAPVLTAGGGGALAHCSARSTHTDAHMHSRTHHSSAAKFAPVRVENCSNERDAKNCRETFLFAESTQQLCSCRFLSLSLPRLHRHPCCVYGVGGEGGGWGGQLGCREALSRLAIAATFCQKLERSDAGSHHVSAIRPIAGLPLEIKGKKIKK